MPDSNLRELARPAYRLIFGQCDSCGTDNRVLTRGVGCGVEGCFCRVCMYDALITDEDDLLDEIERLKPNAETGEEWAHLCALEAALVEMRAYAISDTLETARRVGRMI